MPPSTAPVSAPPVTAQPVYAEHSLVTLAVDRLVDRRVLPKGSRGTVVGIYDRGRGYEVEFTKPFHAVVTLAPGDLTR
jgi:hypothetical protein